MKKYFVFIVAVIFSLSGYSQNPVIINQPYSFQKWVKVKDSLQAANIGADTVFQFPVGCGAPSGTASLKGGNKRKPAFFYDSCGHNLYLYTPQDSTWPVLGGGGGGSVTSIAIASSDFSIAGSPITTNGTITLNVLNNAITNAKFRQSAGISVIGRAANSTGNVADITASTANTFFGYDGSTLGFYKVNLTNGVTGILPVANGGTGTATPGLVNGTGISITGTWPDQTITATGGGGIPSVPYKNIPFGGIGGQQSPGESAFQYDSITNKLSIDSITTKTVLISTKIRLPIRDSTGASEVGELRYDTAQDVYYYKQKGRWRPVNDLANQLVPNCPDCRIGAAVIRPSLSGTTVTWNFIHDPQHDSLFFTGISCSSNNVVLSTPTVTKIYTVIVANDEIFAQAGIDFGSSVTTSAATIQFYRRRGTYAGYLTGDGTNYIKSGSATSWTVVASMDFGLQFLKLIWTNPAGSGQDAAAAVYEGTNGYHTVRHYSALSGADMGWTIRDPFNAYVTDNPTSADVVDIVTGDNRIEGVSACTASDPWSQGIFGAAFANLWVIAVYKL